MTTMVFVNFPVSDIEASTSFYEKIGFKPLKILMERKLESE